MAKCPRQRSSNTLPKRGSTRRSSARTTATAPGGSAKCWRPGSSQATRSQGTVRLRPWQRRALDAFQASERPDFLAVATPGAGKTTFALTAARLTLPVLGRRLVVVAPTRPPKTQRATAAEQCGLQLDADWSPAEGLPADCHGGVTTYQQVATAAEELAALVTRDSMIGVSRALAPEPASV